MAIIDWDRSDELVTVTSLFDQLSALTPDPSGLRAVAVGSLRKRTLIGESTHRFPDGRPVH